MKKIKKWNWHGINFASDPERDRMNLISLTLRKERECKKINDLISLMACVSCSEVDGSMCYNYSHQVHEYLKDYPEEVRQHFIECWIAVSRCVSVNKK